MKKQELENVIRDVMKKGLEYYKKNIYNRELDFKNYSLAGLEGYLFNDKTPFSVVYNLFRKIYSNEFASIIREMDGIRDFDYI